ncbi:hypothetical protein N7522_008484 [Penicillium canescens]|nr:hypothetical protein N7522_008484 [Penicillium canescens]KAJ6176216.1 hypothetical protein N7485_003130 [Penicillium canescens]
MTLSLRLFKVRLLCCVKFRGKHPTTSKPILRPEFQRKPEFAWVWETPPEHPAAMVASAYEISDR